MKETKKQLKYFFATIHKDVLRLILIGGLVLSLIMLVELIVAVGYALNGRSNTNGSGMLCVGFFTLTFIFAVWEIIRCSNRQMRQVFSFPMSRQAYGLGSFLYLMVIAPCIILAMTSLLYGVETLLMEILSRIVRSFCFINEATIGSYLMGLLPSYAIIVGVLSFVYLVSMFFYRHKVLTIVVVIVLGAAFFTSSSVTAVTILGVTFTADYNSMFANDLMDFLFFNPNNISTYIIALLIGVLCHIIAYLPLRRMEVKS